MRCLVDLDWLMSSSVSGKIPAVSSSMNDLMMEVTHKNIFPSVAFIY